MGLRREGDEPVEKTRAGEELTVTEESPEAFLKAAEEEPEVCVHNSMRLFEKRCSGDGGAGSDGTLQPEG